MARPDQNDAANRALRRIGFDPITWAPFLLVGTAYGFLGVPGPISLVMAAGLGVGLLAWWGRRWRWLCDRARLAIVQKWLESENAALRADLTEIVPRLPSDVLAAIGGTGSRAQTVALLLRTLEHKQALERRLFSDGVLTADEEEIIDTLAGLADSIRSELRSLANPARPHAERDVEDPAAVVAVRQACETVRGTDEALDALAGVLAPERVVTPERSRMKEYVENLASRRQQAEAIRRRLAASIQPLPDFGDAPTPIPPSSAQPQ